MTVLAADAARRSTSRSDEIAPRFSQTESFKEITVKLWGKGVVLRGIAGGAEL